MTLGFAAPLSVLFGGILGSFLNVVVWRLPRGESLSHPGSHCPGCESPIRPYDNVPVLSWLILRGRCRDCGMRIPWRYPAVEAGTAVLCGLVALALWDQRPELWLGLLLVLLLVPITLIDLEHHIIPNTLVALGSVGAVAIVAALDPGALPAHLIAAAAAGGFLLIAAFAYPAGMGMGDVKLAGVMGLYLGRSVAVALLVAVLVGAIVGTAVMARVGVKEGRKTAVPFGPFLALGGVVALLVGPAIVHWYLHSMT
jgi:leader peptidase (prepilin peptidase) / N-methyltransferase